MCVCLSQSPQNGLESFESLKYGKDLAKLRVPIKDVRTVDVRKAKRELEQELVQAEGELANAKDTKSARKFTQRRVGKIQYIKQMISFVDLLMQQT